MSPLDGAVVLFVAALGAGWVGFFIPRLLALSDPASGDNRARRWTPLEARSWFLVWALVGLGFIGFGVSVLRHAQGDYVVVPATAPLLDRVIWVGSFVGIFGGTAAVLIWMAMESVVQTRVRARRQRRVRLAEEEQQGRGQSEEVSLSRPVPEPGPRVSRARRLRSLLSVVGASLYPLAFLLLIVVSERFLARVGRTPALVSAAVAYALIPLALGVHALRVRPAPYSLRRWLNQLGILLLVLSPLWGYMLAATLVYGPLSAAAGSLVGFVLMLWLVSRVAIWRRRGGGGAG